MQIFPSILFNIQKVLVTNSSFIISHPIVFFSLIYFSDKKSGTLVLICELMDMNIYELIRGKLTNCFDIYILYI